MYCNALKCIEMGPEMLEMDPEMLEMDPDMLTYCFTSAFMNLLHFTGFFFCKYK